LVVARLVEHLLTYKLVLVLAIAIAIRLGALLAFPNVFAFDVTGAIHGSGAYDTYAQNLLKTGVYGQITPGVPDAQIPPLYSYALAVVYGLFGRGYMQVGLFHILLDGLSIAMLYEIVKRLLRQSADAEWVAALAGLFYAVYPYLIFQNLTLIDTTLFMTLLHAFLLLMVMLRDAPSPPAPLPQGEGGKVVGSQEKPTRARGLNPLSISQETWQVWVLAIGGGLVLGLGMLTRPILPPLAILVAVWFLFRLSLWETVKRLLPVAVIGVLTLTPWILRNYAEFSRFIPMTTTSGSNFWQGNSPFTIAYFRAGYDVQWTSPDNTTIEDQNSPEADAERFALALQFLSENPDKIPELLWVKFWVYWSIDITPRLNPTEGELPRVDYHGNVIVETDDTGNLALGQLPPGDPVAEYSSSLFDTYGRAIHRFYFGALFFLALAGIVLTRHYWREVSLLWFVQLSMTLVYLVFHPSTRYRVPTDPLLFVFSAYALVRAARYYRQRKQRASSDNTWERLHDNG
jgi:4-amino-4-deoxy-L-arabinose transferase-like glycosyltransferase